MAYLTKQFKEALSAIEPGDDKVHAPEAHALVRESLCSDETLSEYCADPILIGSYKRSVSIRRIKDVDVFVRLPQLPSEVTSQEILDRFFRVLHAEFGTDDEGHRRTKRQDRSLQVSFPEFDLYVDAVPARPHSDGVSWEIPQRGDDNEWVRTNPTELTRLSTEMNDLHEGMYVPTVKLMRQTRRNLLGKKKPGGFFIEVATFHAFQSGLVSGPSNAEYYVTTLEQVSSIVSDFVVNGVELSDPTLPGESIKIRATEEELENLKDRFESAAVTARSAFEQEDEGKAAVEFQKLLGKNGDDEIVFPMPPGFNTDGSKREALITPGAPVVPAGKRTFG